MHRSRAGRLARLGSHVYCRYERAGNAEDFGAAITHIETALKATPEDHLQRESRLMSLGSYLSSRYEQTGILEDLELAIDAWVTAWNIPTASILERIESASCAAGELVFGPPATSEQLTRAYSLLHSATHSYIVLLTSFL